MVDIFARGKIRQQRILEIHKPRRGLQLNFHVSLTCIIKRFNPGSFPFSLCRDDRQVTNRPSEDFPSGATRVAPSRQAMVQTLDRSHPQCAELSGVTPGRIWPTLNIQGSPAGFVDSQTAKSRALIATALTPTTKPTAEHQNPATSSIISALFMQCSAAQCPRSGC